MEQLAEIVRASRARYVQQITGTAASPWWTAVVVTASSALQASRYEEEIRRRREDGKLPASARYLVIADAGDTRMGSGGATIHALGALSATAPAGPLESWWAGQRVFMIHAGGDSRRLPQYALTGKLFGPLPLQTPWGEASSVFDELLALSTTWAEGIEAGLLVASGDVILTFPAAEVDWNSPGIRGIAIRQPAEVGTRHGVYIADESGLVYAFLQKPSTAEIRAAGGLLPDGKAAVDTGLLRFDTASATALTRIAPALAWNAPTARIDLYHHITSLLTGQWRPAAADPRLYHELAAALENTPFSCSVVSGDFTHIGERSHFHRLLAHGDNYSRLIEAHQKIRSVAPEGLSSKGVIIDSVFAGGGELGPGSVAIECNLDTPVRAEAGAILHGLSGVDPVDIPADVVVHQLPIAAADGRRGYIFQVYGVDDDPQGPAWFGRPIDDTLLNLGIDPESVWPGVPADECTLWNARLFPLTDLAEAWQSARWMMRGENCFDAARWRSLPRLSLAEASAAADLAAVAEGRTRRRQANWQAAAISLAGSGADVRPLLAHAPGIAPLASTGNSILARATSLLDAAPTEAASQFYQASLFLSQGGLTEQADNARTAAFDAIRHAVQAGAYENPFSASKGPWRQQSISVSAPARIDFGGGWSDTPPFCLDWGGTVLNMAVELNGRYPISTSIRRIDEPVVRCLSDALETAVEFRTAAEILGVPQPGSPLSIPRVALVLAGIVSENESLRASLERRGGGLEIRTAVDLPLGSGLGASSILAATLLRALAEMTGAACANQQLSDSVMLLEQLMTTGGGWQDQVGGIFPGCKLAVSGPGSRQRVRVQPLAWSDERQREFSERFLLYYTGIRRIAKGLLQQVVGSYLGREVSSIQVLHSIKTLALEMAHALGEGDWEYLGELLERHWRLNQVLDPHTTNAPINALRGEIAPLLSGAKLAGAGGGGFLMLLAKSPSHARDLRAKLISAAPAGHASLYEFRIANEGLRVTYGPDPVPQPDSPRNASAG